MQKCCRTAAAGKLLEWQGSACSSTGRICVHSWATNPPKTSKSPSWATLKISALPSSHKELFFSHWNTTVNSIAKEKNISKWGWVENDWTFLCYFLFIEPESKSYIILVQRLFVWLAVVRSVFWRQFISTYMKVCFWMQGLDTHNLKAQVC